MRKSENKGPNSKSPRCPFFNFYVVTREVIFPKMAPILDPVNFFLGFQPYKPLCPFLMAFSFSLSSSFLFGRGGEYNQQLKRGILISKSLKYKILHAPKFCSVVHWFQTVFVFALRPFLPVWVLFFGFNGNFNGN